MENIIYKSNQIGPIILCKKSKQMGNTAFKSELNELDKIVNEILNQVRKKDIDCKNVTIVMESQLNKHLKVELQHLKDTIYFIPHANHVDVKEKMFTKSKLCEMIARHYKKIIDLLVMIKQVYDLEQSGENSIAGMTIRNVLVDNNIMQITYCIMMQHFGDESFLDFKYLTGFEYFNQNFLTNVEREELLFNFKMLFGRIKKPQLAKYMYCGNSLLSGEEYKSILQLKSPKCDKQVSEKVSSFIHSKASSPDVNSYEIPVKRNNPVLHWKACGEKRLILIDLKQKTSKEVDKLYKAMQDNYVKNINDILKCVQQLVENKNGVFKLRHIDTESLNAIQKKIKKLVIKFYLQSITNFHSMLDVAKKVPHFTLNENDVKAANVKSQIF